MKALLLAAALIGGTPASTPQSQWIPFGPNPAWEVFGYVRPDGSTVYSDRRLKPEPPKSQPPVNYGVQLSAQDGALGQSVMGPDADAAKLVFGNSSESEAGCDRERCDRETPPRVLSPFERLALPDLHTITWLVVALAALLAAGLITVLLVALFVYLCRSPSTRTSQ